jgi:hypothetical protein
VSAASLRLARLTLTDFRSYPALSWAPGASIAVVTWAERQRQDEPA